MKQGKTVVYGSVPPPVTRSIDGKEILFKNDSVDREQNETRHKTTTISADPLAVRKQIISPSITSWLHPHHCVAFRTTRPSTNCRKSGYKPLTGQLVCPDHPMQKPHLREGVMLPSVSISSLSRPESKTEALPPRGTKTAWWTAGTWYGTAGR